eukprot:gene6538-10544_t
MKNIPNCDSNVELNENTGSVALYEKARTNIDQYIKKKNPKYMLHFNNNSKILESFAIDAEDETLMKAEEKELLELKELNTEVQFQKKPSELKVIQQINSGTIELSPRQKNTIPAEFLDRESDEDDPNDISFDIDLNK